VHSYAVHTDSVWVLANMPSFGHVYSGGRDQSVSKTILFCLNNGLSCKF
jgi:WD repeat-containing protein 48